MLAAVNPLTVNAANQFVDISLNGVTKPVNIESGSYAIGGNFTNNAATVTALQAAFNADFGAGAVTVAVNGKYLTYTSNISGQKADVVSGTNGGGFT